MLEALTTFLEDMLSALERFGNRLENLAARLLEGLLIFLEEAYAKIIQITKRIWDYLLRLGRALYRLMIALTKLSLFYIPSVVLILAFVVTGRLVFFVGSALWFVFITAVGLTYGKPKE